MQNSPPRLTRNTHPRETGIALVTVLIMIVLMATLVSITSILAIGNRKAGTDTVLSTKAQYAAEAGLENAMYQVYYKTKENWQKTADNNANTKFDACMFRKWLTGVWRLTGTTPTDAQLDSNGNKSCPYGTANLTLPAAPNGATFPTLLDGVMITSSNLLDKVIEGNAANGTRYEVSVSRKEDTSSGETLLTMTSTGIITQSSKDVAFRKLVQVAKISSRAYDGDRFAMLTNATNCSFCHLHVDTMQRAYADPTDKTTVFNRARVAVLNDKVELGNQWHQLDTFIAGTLYIRSTINSDGTKWSDNHVYGPKWAKSGTTLQPGFLNAGPVQSNAADNTNGVIGTYLGNTNADSAIDASIVDASKAPGATTKFAKIYINYPRESALSNAAGTLIYGGQWPDGPVPDDFPSVINEATTTKDGLISDTEWADYLKTGPSGKVVAEANTKIFGVRRPSSSSTNALDSTTPISYDPTSSAVNNTLYASTAQGFNVAAVSPKPPANTLGSSILASDLTTMIANQRAGTSIAWFITKWKGWLLQQALATPNNRDLQPGVASMGADQATTVPISWPLSAQGLAKNNFWLRFSPSASTLTLTYRDFLTATTTVNRSIAIPISETDVFPQNSNKAKVDLEKDGKWDGNLIIDAGRVGDIAQNRALKVDGTIYINGDLVIRGQMKGRGRVVARGNIYVVGDFVYACGDHACRTNETDGSTSYRNSTDLPLIGLLAGGNVIVGDYDFPDYRATSSTDGSYGGGIYDLVNDQVGRKSDALPGNSWPYYSIPGATGSNTGGSGGNMGFVPMIAANANHKNRDSSGYITTSAKRYFQHMPFGPIVGRTGFGSYEGDFLNTVGNATVIPIYPSNGPIRTGDNTNSGMTTAAGLGQIGTGLGCSSPDTSVAAVRFLGGNVTFNYGFYCPPGVGQFLRNSLTPSGGKNPGTESTVWTSQSPQNKKLDGEASGVGATTGWLGGLLGYDTGSVGSTGTPAPTNKFSQIGDLSQSRLIKLMWLTTMDVNRDADKTGLADTTNDNGPLRTDGIFYSANGIFSIARSFSNTWKNESTAALAIAQRSTTEGRWIHNGSVVAAELGFLITGDYSNGSKNSTASFLPDSGNVKQNYTLRRNKAIDFKDQQSYSGLNSAFNSGPAMGIFYDERLAGFLNLTSGVPVQIQRIGGYQQASR